MAGLGLERYRFGLVAERPPVDRRTFRRSTSTRRRLRHAVVVTGWPSRHRRDCARHHAVRPQRTRAARHPASFQRTVARGRQAGGYLFDGGAPVCDGSRACRQPERLQRRRRQLLQAVLESRAGPERTQFLYDRACRAAGDQRQALGGDEGAGLARFHRRRPQGRQPRRRCHPRASCARSGLRCQVCRRHDESARRAQRPRCAAPGAVGARHRALPGQRCRPRPCPGAPRALAVQRLFARNGGQDPHPGTAPDQAHPEGRLGAARSGPACRDHAAGRSRAGCRHQGSPGRRHGARQPARMVVRHLGRGGRWRGRRDRLLRRGRARRHRCRGRRRRVRRLHGIGANDHGHRGTAPARFHPALCRQPAPSRERGGQRGLAGGIRDRNLRGVAQLQLRALAHGHLLSDPAAPARRDGVRRRLRMPVRALRHQAVRPDACLPLAGINRSRVAPGALPACAGSRARCRHGLRPIRHSRRQARGPARRRHSRLDHHQALDRAACRRR